MSKLFFALRHGERADKVPSDRKFEIPYDPCLTEFGLEQAQIAAETVASYLSPGLKVHLVSSPFLRCVETASKIALKLSIPIHLEEGFAEILEQDLFTSETMDGLYLTKEKEKVEAALGVQLIENEHISRPIYPETYLQGNRRVVNCWREYLSRYSNYDVIIVVSHWFVVDQLTEAWSGQMNTDSGYCKLTVASSNGTYQLLKNADSSYMPQQEL